MNTNVLCVLFCIPEACLSVWSWWWKLCLLLMFHTAEAQLKRLSVWRGILIGASLHFIRLQRKWKSQHSHSNFHKSVNGFQNVFPLPLPKRLSHTKPTRWVTRPNTLTQEYLHYCQYIVYCISCQCIVSTSLFIQYILLFLFTFIYIFFHSFALLQLYTHVGTHGNYSKEK